MDHEYTEDDPGQVMQAAMRQVDKIIKVMLDFIVSTRNFIFQI